MMAAMVAVLAGLLSSLGSKRDPLPYVSDGGHVMAPPPNQINPTPLDLGDWTLLGGEIERTPYTAVDSIGATNVKYLTVAWTFSVDEPRGHIRGPR